MSTIEGAKRHAIGVSMKRKEDPRLIRGRGRFVDDISLPNHKAWAQYLQGNRGYFKAQIFWPPKRWMTGGILGMLQSPGPRVAPPESIPTADFPWELQGPLDPAVFPPTPL